MICDVIRLTLAEMRLSVFADQPFLRQMHFKRMDQCHPTRAHQGHQFMRTDISRMS